MAANSAIEWTDQTWNPVVGCEKVSPGCAHCYAEVMAARLKAMALSDIDAGKDPGRKRHYIDAIDDKGRWSGKLIPVPEALADPLGWKKPRRVFVNSMSDLFHESVPDEFIDKVFAVMNATQHKLPIPADLNAKPWHTYQVLTKRAERMYRYMESRRSVHFKNGEHPLFSAGRGDGGPLRGHGLDVMNAGAVLSWPPSNVWLGVSCENQKTADERIPWLLKTPAAVRFLSCEPLLGPINLQPQIDQRSGEFINAQGINCDWIIVGGESGHGARPCRLTWIRDIVRRCADVGVPCFVKQLGSNAETGLGVHRKVKLEAKKGGDWDEWPEDLRVRQFPQSEAAHA